MGINRKPLQPGAADRKSPPRLAPRLAVHPIPVPPDLYAQTPDNLEAWLEEATDAIRAELQSRRWS